jgi:hypothetical protein
VRLRRLNGIDFIKLHEKIPEGSAETANNIFTYEREEKYSQFEFDSFGNVSFNGGDTDSSCKIPQSINFFIHLANFLLVHRVSSD